MELFKDVEKGKIDVAIFTGEQEPDLTVRKLYAYLEKFMKALKDLIITLAEILNLEIGNDEAMVYIGGKYLFDSRIKMMHIL